MIFEANDHDLREIAQLAKGILRTRYRNWALWCGLEDGYNGWAQDQVTMGIAVAYHQIEKWDQVRHPSFAKWVWYKIEDLARDDLRKRTRRKLKQSQVDESIIEDLMAREPLDGFETCIHQDSLKGVLKHLNPVMQAVIALYYCGGLTDPEISKVLKMNLATVQSNRLRALERAREYYVILHSPKTSHSSPVPPRTRKRKPRDSTESPGEDPPAARTCNQGPYDKKNGENDE